MCRLLQRCVLAIAVPGLSGLLVASAAPAKSRAALDPASSPVLEEIIVTAQRREQRLADVSIAITAVGSDDIAQLGMTDTASLVHQVPTLQVKSTMSKSNPQIFMRGIGVNDDTALTSGSVGLYADEVFIGAPSAQLFPLFDLERIEVLRGPQGTLYGRNTTGGAVNFVSRQPGESLEAMLNASIGRFNERMLEGAVGGPLGDRLAARLALIVNRRDGYMYNRELDTNDATVDNWAARLALRYDIYDDFSVSLKLHGGGNDAIARQFRNQGLIDPDSAAGGTPAPCLTPSIAGTCSDLLGYIDDGDPYAGRWDRRGSEEIDLAGADLKVRAGTASVELTSISAFRNADRDLRPDTDASPNQVLHIDWLESNEQISQEVRLASRGDERLRWLLGAFYLDQTISIDQKNDVFRELRPVFGFDPSQLIVTVNTRIDQQLRSYAAFGQVDFRFSERGTLVAGLRYTSEERDMNRLDALTEPAFTIPLVSLRDSVSVNNLSGKLALELRDNQGNLAYASAASGFKSGGFNGAVALDPGAVPPFEEETLTAYEVGLKWRGLGERLGVNAAAFLTDYEDLQVFTRMTSNGIPREILTNAANARVLGFEAELFARPYSGLEARFGIGLLDSKLKDFRTDSGQDFSGNDLVGAPRFTLNGMLRQTIVVGNRTVALQANYHYQDRVYFETSNDPLLAQRAYGILDGRITMRCNDERMEIALWGRNLLDERYLDGVVGLGVFGYNLQSWGEPRTYGMALTWRHR